MRPSSRSACRRALFALAALGLLNAFPGAALAQTAPTTDFDESAGYGALPASASVKQPGVGASGAVLMEASTGRVLMSVNPDKKLPMASTTKVMTALLAIERGRLSEVITVSPSASGVEGSSMYLEVGEKITLENLLYGLMLASGNDAAVAIAEHIGGSVEGFAALMNQRARQIGCKSTNFVTPNGLDSKEHYTTAYDLGLIACEAMKNEKFVEIVSTQYKKMPWEGHQWERALKNKNRIIFQFDGGNGVKTGFTKRAGKCLVSAAKRGDLQLVSVVLNCGGMFPESMSMLEYGFSVCSMQTLLKKGEAIARIALKGSVEKDLELRATHDIMVPLLEGEAERVEKKLQCPETLEAPVKKGDPLAKLSFELDGKILAQFEFVAQKDIGRADVPYYLGKIIGEWNAASLSPQGLF